MHKAFCVAIEDLTGQRTFIRFGALTPITDIIDVITEECKDNGGKILGFTFCEAKSEKGLMKVIAEWKNHF